MLYISFLVLLKHKYPCSVLLYVQTILQIFDAFLIIKKILINQGEGFLDQIESNLEKVFFNMYVQSSSLKIFIFKSVYANVCFN